MRFYYIGLNAAKSELIRPRFLLGLIPVDTDYQGSSQIYIAYIVGHLSHFPMSICSMKVLKRTFPFKGIVEGSGHALQTSPIERFTFMIQLKNFSSVQFYQFFCCFCLNKGYVAFMHLFGLLTFTFGIFVMMSYLSVSGRPFGHLIERGTVFNL